MVSTATIALLALSLSTMPTTGGALTITRVNINTSAGDQTDPHVDLDLAAYTSETSVGPKEIRYFRFPGGPDLAVPNALPGGAYAFDYLSDVDQGRIAFTRGYPNNTWAIMLFDTRPSTPTLTEIAAAPGSFRLGVALGSQSLLFADYGLTGTTGEMVHFNLQTSVSTRLTTDADNDLNPAVSPDGNVLVWEKCPGTSVLGSCQVLQSRWDGTQWVTSTVAAAPSSNPDTNGALVVYEGTRAGSLTSTDIFTRPVAGGAEVALEIPGVQRNPSIRGSIIAFESRDVGADYSDIFLYDLASNRLFQVTATPLINENLNDVTVLPSGDVRVVWAAQDDADGISGNVYGATFTIPADPNGGTGGGAGGGTGGGAGGGAGGGGGSSCANRSSTLEATRFFRPTRWSDADASYSPAFAFTLPAQIPVTAGNSGNHWVHLTLTTTAGYQTMCKYRGGASGAHPQSAAQIAAGLTYHFEFCTGQGMPLRAGDRIEVTRAQLHVDGGDSWQPLTTVSLTLTEVCAPPPPSAGCSHGSHDKEDGDDDDHDTDDSDHHRLGRAHKAQSPDPLGTTEQGLDAEPMPAMGCSSTSGGLAWPALLLVLAFFAFHRRAMPIRLTAAQERRRLRR